MTAQSGQSARPRQLALPARRLRFVVVAFWLQLKMIATSAFDGILQVVWPLFFATATFFIYRITGDRDALLYAALGASMMGVWSAVATTASGALQRERYAGTLELVVSSPTSFATTMVPIVIAMASLGLYSIVATLLWGRFVFDVPLHIDNVPAFVLAVLVAIISVAMVGFLLSVTVVRYRTAWALGNVLEYPGWLLCGFLIPLSVLPGWAQVMAKALPPTWAVRAIREVARGDSPWGALGICVALGVGYAAVAAVIANRLLRSARQHAALSLT